MTGETTWKNEAAFGERANAKKTLLDETNKSDVRSTVYDGDDEDAPRRKRGRPAGAKNLPKAERVWKPRKKPIELRDTRSGIDRYTKALNETIKKHNAKHGTKIREVDDPMAQHAGPPPAVIPPEPIADLLRGVVDIVGDMAEVKARPTPASINATAQAWSSCSGYLETDLDPKIVSIGGAVVMTLIMISPMIVEVVKRKREPVATLTVVEDPCDAPSV